MAKMVFELLNGSHYERNQETGGLRRYEAGEKVTSIRPLHQLFRNRFRLIEVIDDCPPQPELVDETGVEIPDENPPEPKKPRTRRRRTVG